MATTSDDAKVMLTGAEVKQITDSLARVREAVGTAPAMFLGGPTPAAVLETVTTMLDGKVTASLAGIGGIRSSTPQAA